MARTTCRCPNQTRARPSHVAYAAAGGSIAGHLVGNCPHQRVPGNKVLSYIAPGNDQPLRCVDSDGNPRHWILEIHFVDEVDEVLRLALIPPLEPRTVTGAGPKSTPRTFPGKPRPKPVTV